MELFIHDFPNYVRKGFCRIKSTVHRLRVLYRITVYMFFGAINKCLSGYKCRKYSDSFYDMIDRRIEEFKQHGIDEEDITAIIHAELDYKFSENQ